MMLPGGVAQYSMKEVSVSDPRVVLSVVSDWPLFVVTPITLDFQPSVIDLLVELNAWMPWEFPSPLFPLCFINDTIM